MNDKISHEFGLPTLNECKSTSIEIRKETALAKKLPVAEESDYEYARENLKDLISKGTSALEDLIELAKMTEAPNAYVVLAQLLKTVGDQNISLVHMQERVKAREKEQEKAQNPDKPEMVNIQNALFVGTPSELQKLLKDG